MTSATTKPDSSAAASTEAVVSMAAAVACTAVAACIAAALTPLAALSVSAISSARSDGCVIHVTNPGLVTPTKSPDRGARLLSA